MKVVKERTEILLMEYASGALDEASSLLMASYITLCPEARRYMSECETLGGALMECCVPVSMHKESMQNVLGRLEDECSDGFCEQEKDFCKENALPKPVSDHINNGTKNIKWYSGFSRGVQYCTLPVEDSHYKISLVKMAPHAKTLRHSHNGKELTLVMQGGYHDEYGHYQAGDLVISNSGSDLHQPIADNTGCLCLTVLEAPVRFTGSWGFVLNFFGR